jgi:hypothetical protein
VFQSSPTSISHFSLVHCFSFNKYCYLFKFTRIFCSFFVLSPQQPTLCHLLPTRNNCHISIASPRAVDAYMHPSPGHEPNVSQTPHSPWSFPHPPLVSPSLVSAATPLPSLQTETCKSSLTFSQLSSALYASLWLLSVHLLYTVNFFKAVNMSWIPCMSSS